MIGTSESPNGEILEGAQNLFNLLEDSLVGEFHFGEEENPSRCWSCKLCNTRLIGGVVGACP